MLRIKVNSQRETLHCDHLAGPIEIGREAVGGVTPRLVVPHDLRVSRSHVRLTELTTSLVRVENISKQNPIRLDDGSTIPGGSQADLACPLHLMLGEAVHVEITFPPEDPPSIDGLSRNLLDTVDPLPMSAPSPAMSMTALQNHGEAPSPAQVGQWLDKVVEVQQAAAGSVEFYQKAAQALVDLVGLDKGLVLLRRQARWEIAARAVVREGGYGRDFSMTVLNYVVNEGRTLYQKQAMMDASESLTNIEAVVAAPIFDSSNNVVGVLYGTRNRYLKGRGTGVGPLEAQLVRVLASALGTGLARQAREADAVRFKVQLEQAFTSNLADELLSNPSILEGQQRDVTVLFSDIRGFSRMSEAMASSPKEVFRLVREVMDCLTKHVRAEEGIVVDYYGDGMCAMWNAPFDQADHAVRACRTACGVMAELTDVSERWHSKLCQPLVVGMGINTGSALVGNTGSEWKVKYGPFGHTVNLAQRVEGATKHLGVSVLVTGNTRTLVQDYFPLRRLCKARLSGMKDPVDLYELDVSDRKGMSPSAAWDAYEDALQHFEQGQWFRTCHTLAPLLNEKDDCDRVGLNLLARAVECLRAPPASFDGVWELATK